MTSERSVSGTTRSGKQMPSLVGALLFAVVSHAALVQSLPPLTPEQEAIARHLDQTFIAPCCFTNTLAEHRSPVAEELRQEIRTLLASGATEPQIVDAFVAKYGERILAAPKPQGFSLLAYVLPVVVLAAGLVVVVTFVVRRQRPHAGAPSAGPPSEITDRLRARVEEELARFDE